jgi:UDP-N-acetylglucosamine 1-carboxyvinyltransferase
MAETAVADVLAEAFVIEGGRRLEGRVRAAGNKNAALPLLASCVLAREEVRLENVPRIRDVETMIALLNDIGGEADWTGPNDVRINTASAHRHELSEALCSRMRASILLAGPLLARFGAAVVPAPGGDPIGRRRLDVHMHALAELGADVRFAQPFEFRADRLSGKRIYLDEPSVTGTENAIMASVTAEGETVLVNAASEPHVQDLCQFLVSLGARIEGIGSNTLRIEGVRHLGGGSWRICPDHVEVGSFIGCAAVTGGDVTIDECRPDDLVSILPAFERLGIHVEVDGSSVRVPPGQELAIHQDLGAMVPKIEDGPWPAFPADLTSIALIVATQAKGEILIFEKMFESRLFFVDKLVSMGARAILCDPHRVVVTGPAKLYGQRMSSPDIRAGMAMVMAALCAEGTSTIGDAYQIDKGYERIDERLRALGASIERIDGGRL